MTAAHRGRVLILEPVSAGSLLIGAARRLGYHVTVVTADRGARTLRAADRAVADEILVADGDDVAGTLALVGEAHTVRAFDAVLPGVEYYVPLAAEIAARLGLPGLTLEAARSLRYKHLMRDALAARGVPVPRYRTVELDRTGWADAVHDAIAYTGLPCVVKPVDLAESAFVCRVDSRTEAVAAVARLASAVTSSRERKPGPVALVEEYVRGPEYSVEGYVSVDGPCVVSVTRKLLGPEPYFVERGHVVGASLAPTLRSDIVRYIASVVRALRLDLGVFHAEVRTGPDGPVLMEIAARLPGGQICRLIHVAYGIDLPGAFVESMLGRPPAHRPLPDPDVLTGVRFLLRPGLHEYTTTHGMEVVEQMPGFVGLALAYQPGEPIPAVTDSTGRVGWVMFTGPDEKTLGHRLDRAESVLVLE